MKDIHGTLIKRFHHVWSHGLVMATIFRWLSRLGITIVPYYLFLETDNHSNAQNIRPMLDQPYKIMFLNRNNSHLIKGFKNLSQVESEFSRLWDTGCSCVCLASEGSILAYGWYDLVTCNYKYLSFKLNNNEAYSFNYYTARHIRGKNIAAYIRCIIADHLRSLGRNMRYSITEQFNTPAIKFAAKRNAQLMRYYVYMNLFNRIRKNILIRILQECQP